jgi:4a-hydroxytetrahydrobiopterin dehydratase
MSDDATYGPEVLETEGLSDWAWREDALHARFATGDFATGLRLVNLIGESAEAMDHHPDLDLRYPHVDMTVSSHDAGGVTDRDVRLARLASEHAAGLGVHPA